MEAMRIIMDEHQSLAAIIHAIRLMIHEIGAGKLQPDFKLFAAMVRYLDAYPEKRHHPKEDAFLFAPLKARTHEGDEALARLEAEHAQAEARIATLQAALARYTDGAPDGFARFSAAFDAYADFYRNHMMLEEDAVLPLVLRHFSPDDQAEIDARFAAEMKAGALPDGQREDFDALFAKLVDCAPAPIGFGPRPFAG